MSQIRRLFKSETGRAAVPAFAVSLIGRIMQIAMAVVAARLLLPDGYGLLTFAMGVGLLGGRVTGLGWPILMNRFVPKYTVEENWSLLRGLVRSADWVTLSSGFIGGLACIQVAFWLGEDNNLYSGLILGGALVPVMAFRSLLRNLLAALKVPHRGIMVDELVPATLMTLFLLLALLSGRQLNPGDATLLYLLASLLGVLSGYCWVKTRFPAKAKAAVPVYKLKMWLQTSLPALVGTSARLLMNRADILMLAPLATLADVGLYGAAMRVTYLQAAPIIVLSTVVTARLGEAFAAGRIRQGQRLFIGAFVFATVWSVPVALFLIAFDERVMSSVFGQEYTAGASVLTILAIAQVGAAINVPATSFMLMTGRQKTFGKLTVAALILNVIGNFILIPALGAVGAAIATCISILVLTVMELVACAAIIRSGRFEEHRA